MKKNLNKKVGELFNLICKFTIGIASKQLGTYLRNQLSGNQFQTWFKSVRYPNSTIEGSQFNAAACVGRNEWIGVQGDDNIFAGLWFVFLDGLGEKCLDQLLISLTTLNKDISFQQLINDKQEITF